MRNLREPSPSAWNRSRPKEHGRQPRTCSPLVRATRRRFYRQARFYSSVGLTRAIVRSETIPRQSRGFYRRWPIKGTYSRRRKGKKHALGAPSSQEPSSRGHLAMLGFSVWASPRTADRRNCQTLAATPAEPGGLSFWSRWLFVPPFSCKGSRRQQLREPRKTTPRSSSTGAVPRQSPSSADPTPSRRRCRTPGR